MRARTEQEEALDLLNSLDPKRLGTWALPGPLSPQIIYKLWVHQEFQEFLDEAPRVVSNVGDVSNRPLRTRRVEEKTFGGVLEFDPRTILERVDPGEQILRSMMRPTETNPNWRLIPQGAAVARRKIQQLQEDCAKLTALK